MFEAFVFWFMVSYYLIASVAMWIIGNRALDGKWLWEKDDG